MVGLEVILPNKHHKEVIAAPPSLEIEPPPPRLMFD
jgi:hypothetical protein